MSRLTEQYRRYDADIDDPRLANALDLRTRRIHMFDDLMDRVAAHLVDNPPETGAVFHVLTEDVASWPMGRADDSPLFFFLEDGRVLSVEYNRRALFDFQGGDTFPDRHVFELLCGFVRRYEVPIEEPDDDRFRERYDRYVTGRLVYEEPWDCDERRERDLDAAARRQLYDDPPAIEYQERRRRRWWQRH